MNQYPWVGELPALAALSDQEAADAINAMTVPAPTRLVYCCFRTFAGILTQSEYNTLRAALEQTAAVERQQGGYFYSDMLKALEWMAEELSGNGGIPVNHPVTQSLLSSLCAAANLPDVPAKVAAYAASLQPPPVRKYAETVLPGYVADARRGL